MPPPNISDVLREGRDHNSAGHTKIFGVVLGIVEGIESNAPGSKGRVQISLPWLDSGMQIWAEVAHPPGASGNYAVGDTVVVAFEHGDPRFAIVLGRIGNAAT